MSDKSEIEAIRARDARRKYVTGIIEAQVWQDRRALLSHVDALLAERDAYVLKQKVWEDANDELRTADIVLRRERDAARDELREAVRLLSHSSCRCPSCNKTRADFLARVGKQPPKAGGEQI